MTHPDDGQIQALLDGEVVGAEASSLRAHLDGCSPCGARLRGQEEAVKASSLALTLLDAEPRTEEVRAKLDARLRFHREKRIRGWSLLTLPRAASIALLLTGAAATALPGSPVRSWILDGWRALTGTEGAVSSPATTAPEQDPLPPAAEPTPAETGASIPAVEGVEIGIQDLEPGAELLIQWVDGADAGIFAGEGTGYRTEAGRVEAFSPTGRVRVEIPRTLDRVEVRVNGNVVLRKAGAEIQILAPVTTRDPNQILLRPGGAPNGGRP